MSKKLGGAGKIQFPKCSRLGCSTNVCADRWHSLAPTSLELELKFHPQIENLEWDIKHAPPRLSSLYPSLGAAVCSPLRLRGPEHVKRSDCAFVSLSLCPGEAFSYCCRGHLLTSEAI